MTPFSDSRLKNWLGDMPATTTCSQEIETISVREFRDFTETKIIYRGHLDEEIPAYYLLPRNTRPPIPGIVAFHQCGAQCDVGKEQVVGKRVDLPDQAYGFELAKRGYAVLAPDAKMIGERFDSSLREQWECAYDRKAQDRCCCAPGGPWGSPRWQRVFDAMRAIDVLAARPEIDSSRLGAMGHSLGADTIVWLLPFEDTLRAVAISGGGIMNDRADSWLPYALHRYYTNGAWPFVREFFGAAS